MWIVLVGIMLALILSLGEVEMYMPQLGALLVLCVLPGLSVALLRRNTDSFHDELFPASPWLPRLGGVAWAVWVIGYLFMILHLPGALELQLAGGGLFLVHALRYLQEQHLAARQALHVGPFGPVYALTAFGVLTGLAWLLFPPALGLQVSGVLLRAAMYVLAGLTLWYYMQGWRAAATPGERGGYLCVGAGVAAVIVLLAVLELLKRLGAWSAAESVGRVAMWVSTAGAVLLMSRPSRRYHRLLVALLLLLAGLLFASLLFQHTQDVLEPAQPLAGGAVMPGGIRGKGGTVVQVPPEKTVRSADAGDQRLTVFPRIVYFGIAYTGSGTSPSLSDQSELNDSCVP